MHHPEYKYRNQPEKAATPPSKKTPARPKPPAKVLPNPSPADSTIAGVGKIMETTPVMNRRWGGRPAIRKDPPDAVAVDFKESFEEGNADDGVLLGNDCDELGNLGDSDE